MSHELEILKRYWGHHSFRPSQSQVIASVLENRDTLALMPTGGGKSICFQVPTMMRPGLTLVITPLIALMKDQVRQLNDLGIKATAVYSGMSSREIDIKLDNCVYGEEKFLYLSPERLKSELFRSRLVKMQIQLLVVDEAHCISEWGHDFRPSYREIAQIRELTTDISILALTATATKEVKEDIVTQLHFKDGAVFQVSFGRPNLSYQVKVTEDKPGELIEMVKSAGGSSLVYVNTRKKSSTLAMALQREGIKAGFYHGGLPAPERSAMQDRWLNNQILCMVATNAFGMGINKADVRLVVHYEMPDHIEAYYQEAGRAGRDGKLSKAVLLYQEGDAELLKERKMNEYPEISYLKEIYQQLANYYQLAIGSEMRDSEDFDLEQFSLRYQHKPLQVFHALKRLKQFGYLELTEDLLLPTQFRFTAGHQQVYEFQIANSVADPVIKALLRLYGGELFSVPVNISERKIASLLQWESEQVSKALQSLQDHGLAIFQAKKDRPQIFLTTSRLDSKTLVFGEKAYGERKNLELNKLKAMKSYATNHRLCRSLQLLEYFGEFSDNKCGICDVCQSQIPVRNEAVIINDIKQELTRSPKTLIGLSQVLSGHDPKHIAHTIQEMLELGEVRYDELGRLSIKDVMA